MNKKLACALGALFCMGGVILGAFGAHALKENLEQREMVEVWKTAVSYQMWHGLALILIGATEIFKKVTLPLLCFTVGIVFFSGSLYWLSLDGPRWLGPITPLGGLLMITGWSVFIIGIFRHGVKSDSTAASS